MDDKSNHVAGRGRGAADGPHPDRGRRGPAEADPERHRAEARDVHQAGAEHQGAARDVHGHLRPDREPGRDGQPVGFNIDAEEFLHNKY